MVKSICGVNCIECHLKDNCRGCRNTNGQPFGERCVLAVCCHNKGYDCCGDCTDIKCSIKKQLIDEINALDIEDMEKVTSLNALKGSFVNLEYNIANGKNVRLLDDNKIYLGNQVCKMNSDRVYGVVADENYILVSEYGSGGLDAEIVIFKRRN